MVWLTFAWSPIVMMYSYISDRLSKEITVANQYQNIRTVFQAVS